MHAFNSIVKLYIIIHSIYHKSYQNILKTSNTNNTISWDV